MLLILNLPLVGLFARVATIAPRHLAPTVLLLCAVGSFADNPFDVVVMVAAGVLGYVLRLFAYDPAPLVLGLVLGPMLERSLLQALTISQGDPRGLWDSTPSAVMLALGFALALMPLLSWMVGGRADIWCPASRAEPFVVSSPRIARSGRGPPNQNGRGDLAPRSASSSSKLPA